MFHIYFGMLRHVDRERYSGQRPEKQLQWLFWHLWAAGSWYFPPAAMSQIRLFYVLFEEKVGSVHVCVCVFLCTFACVYAYQALKSVEKLGHDVCKGPVLIMASLAFSVLCPAALCTSINLTSFKRHLALLHALLCKHATERCTLPQDYLSILYLLQ